MVWLGYGQAIYVSWYGTLEIFHLKGFSFALELWASYIKLREVVLTSLFGLKRSKFGSHLWHSLAKNSGTIHSAF